MNFQRVNLIEGIFLTKKEFSLFMINYLAEYKKTIKPEKFYDIIYGYYQNLNSERENELNENGPNEIINEFENSMNKKNIFKDISIFLNFKNNFNIYAVIGWKISVIDFDLYKKNKSTIGFPKSYSPCLVNDSLIDKLKKYGIEKYNYTIISIIDTD